MARNLMYFPRKDEQWVYASAVRSKCRETTPWFFPTVTWLWEHTVDENLHQTFSMDKSLVFSVRSSHLIHTSTVH